MSRPKGSLVDTAGGNSTLEPASHPPEQPVTMVEKIRESYQKHSRNVSTVSDISAVNAEPLKRDAQAEIRVVLLCDSEVERHCVFEAVGKALADGESAIGAASILQHHWEQPHVDPGAECRLSPGTAVFADKSGGEGVNGGAGGFFLGGGQHKSSSLPLDGFFRFTLNGTTFRLMLLSKDRQNLLKIYSFDFIMVGMQVVNGRGVLLDQQIWDFEWKRLSRHSKRAVAPIILLGYFRDVLKLGGGDISLHKTVEDSRAEVRKIGRVRKAIPRFCDFVTGNSVQLENLFGDLERLYRQPGFVLQQCAYVNNETHFCKIAENPNLCEDDVQYRCDKTGDNPIMIAAKLRHKDLVCAVLRSPKFANSDGGDLLRNVVHARNNTGQTLLAMVALQGKTCRYLPLRTCRNLCIIFLGPELEEQKLLILQKEIQIHCESELTHEADQLKLQRCLRGQLKSSAEAATILDQSRALQGIPKTEHELKAENGKVWSRLFFASLLLSLLFNAIDTGSDILIMIRYYGEMVGDVVAAAGNSTCDDAEEENLPTEQEMALMCGGNLTDPNHLYSIQCFPSVTRLHNEYFINITNTFFPQALSPQRKFGYTLFFILVPWPFFIYEFFTSRQYTQLVAKGKQIVGEMSACSGTAEFCRAYFKAILYSVTFVSCLLLWPIAVLFVKYYNDGKYYLAKGQAKAEREKKIEASEVLFSTARVMEVSLESSFQPTIQLYLLFPVLVRTMTANYFSFRLFSICKDKSLNFPMLKTDQTISIITSILSLAWCFTFYHATLKRGALDRDLAALFYRAVLFLGVLFQIIGRLFILVLFAYTFGPGNYFPVLVFLGCHILLMTVLHFVFSDAKVYWQKGGILNLSFFHYMVGNGLANIYIHNWIRMDPLLIPFSKPLQHVSTFMRQVVFDAILMVENIVLLAVALNSNVRELRDNQLSFACFLLGFSFVGVILKCVYYRYLHIWAWLIMDYITEKRDGHWTCHLYSNMYLCGELKERRLLLCCIPRPVYSALGWFCQSRQGCGSCSVCSVLVTLLLLPLATVLALVALVVCLALAVAFVPVFVVLVLPCIVVFKLRTDGVTEEPIRKVFESERSRSANPDDFAPFRSQESRGGGDSGDCESGRIDEEDGEELKLMGNSVAATEEVSNEEQGQETRKDAGDEYQDALVSKSNGDLAQKLAEALDKSPVTRV
jgi:hypothetical protein